MNTILTRTPTLLVLSGGLLLSTLVRAQVDYPLKLSESSVPGGGVLDFEYSEDGKWIVYLADHDTDFVAEIYSVRAAGGAVVKLNPPLVSGGDVLDFQISEDGTRVVYRADQETNQEFELYSTPIHGGAVTKLSGPLPLGGDVLEFEISEDRSCVVYRADQDTNLTFELYSVPILGGRAEKLNDPLGPGLDVQPDFKISEDGGRVVYRADQEIYNTVELYSVPIFGGAPTKLNGPLPGSGDVVEFQITVPPIGSPGAGRVVYRADGNNDQVFELYGVAIEGGPVLKLNGPLTANGDVIDFKLDSDSEREERRGNPPESIRVVYRADQETNQLFELFSAPISGGPATKLSGAMVTGGDVVDFEVSQDGKQVVYRADQRLNTVVELHSVPIAGGEVTALNPALPSAGDVLDFEISAARDPDDVRVVYRADQEKNEIFELYSVSVRGGAIAKLNPGLTDGGNVAQFAVSPDGRRVCYLADQEINGVAEVFNVPIEGGEARKLNSALVNGGDVIQFEFSPDGGRVAYSADQETDRTVDLYGWVTATPETYAEFAAFHELRTAPDADEEEDGLPNLFEYLTGRNPGTRDFGVELPTIEHINNEVHVSWIMITPPAGSDLQLEVKSSTTLNNGRPGGWQVIASRIGTASWTGRTPVTVTPAGEGLERAVLVEPAVRDPARFYRLDLRVRP